MELPQFNCTSLCRRFSYSLLAAALWTSTQAAASPITLSQDALKVADYAVSTYDAQMVESLAHLISFNTQAVEGQTPDTNPAFIGFKSSLKSLSQELGLDYADHGYVVLIGLDANVVDAQRSQVEKLGIVTHGDVQPANPALWAKSPYVLDTESEPGKLIGRGTEDDKGAIVTAMYAMKAIKDKQLKREKRIELLVYLAEESDWDPLKAFLAHYTPAQMNITIDAEYPVVTAEKGWSKIGFTVPNLELTQEQGAAANVPSLTAFSGGYFASQVPQQAEAKIHAITPSLLAQLQASAANQQGMKYRFERTCEQAVCDLHILADGKAAHSSTPEDGVNAVTHLAALLQPYTWPKTTAALTVAAMNELVGLGIYAEQFGELAYKDDFMGALTLAPTVVAQTSKGTEVTINLRRPVGKTPELLSAQAKDALNKWQVEHQVTLIDVESYWGEPMVMKDAPHQQTLLDVFAHFTGIASPKPVAIGGSTNSKLFPNALSFGPAMPGVEYTGHTEKEFITHKQFMLNLKMYTAAFIELTAAK